ncbi:MAG: lipoprotein-releasing ABC transporter ATP-binding protein LolD [Gammaproteobacteria bacterium]|nr:lipoprotein-releasing ABC transporter ATP-binding protein LolD [Gammaproteobacteria bacterium]
MSSEALRCSGLVKSFGHRELSVEVLHGLNLSVGRGELVGIVGASGSGKSTLLHLLGGLDTPSAGELFIEGQRLSALSIKALSRLRNRALGFVYQFHHLLPEFNALENVAMPLLIGGAAAQDAAERADALLSRVGLAARGRHHPSQLSGGERQRVALARALVTRPACILADEPTGNLDRRTAEQVFELVLDLNKEQGTSLVMVTHDHAMVERVDRVLELVDGRLR